MVQNSGNTHRKYDLVMLQYKNINFQCDSKVQQKYNIMNDGVT